MERGGLSPARAGAGVTVASTAVAALGESPLWHPGLACLFWIDIDGRQLHRLDPSSGSEAQWALPEAPGCIGLVAEADGSMATDRLVIALRSGFHRLHWHADGKTPHGRIELTRLAPPLFDGAQFRFNDGKVDPDGRFWAGTLFERKGLAAAGLYCLERGRARAVTGPDAAEFPWRQWGVTTSNGLAFSPDGKVLYQSDTPAHAIYAHDFDAATGRVLNRRVWWHTSDDRTAPDYPGRPDGAAVDVAGCYWTALYDGGRIIQLSPAGELLQSVAIPARCPTMVAFGGPDRGTLYVTSSRGGRPAAELAQWPDSGRVFSIAVPVAGLPACGYRE